MTDLNTLKNFLKKYTAIPNKFIDEYYNFYEKCTNNAFGIECSYVIKYLSISDSKQFYKRLRDSYELGIDFVIKKELVDKNANSLKNTYHITFDCFEKLCLASKSLKGAEVRDYVVILRKFINYYKDHIAEKINDLAKYNSYIYILLVNREKNIFKVGVTKNMRKRLQTYATGRDKHPDIKFIMIVNNPKVVEKCVKIFGKNSQYKVGKELYKIDYDTLKKLAFNCGAMDKEFSGKKKANYDAYVVYDETKSSLYLDLNDNVIGYEKDSMEKRKVSKKGSIKRKISKKGSIKRKISKKGSIKRKISKKCSIKRKISKKGSKK